jgi:gamma-glutamyltranspeptidase/glutathione hydrolase
VESRLPEATRKTLSAHGHKLSVKGDWDPYFGGVQAVLFDSRSKLLIGGADPRRDGKAIAY